jgi:hypothetical protein
MAAVADAPTPKLPLVSTLLAAIASAMLAVVWSVLWLPFYVTGSQGQLHLYPLALLSLVPIWGVAVAAVVTGTIALRRLEAGRPFTVALVGTVLGGTVLLGALPVLWFGGATVPV